MAAPAELRAGRLTVRHGGARCTLLLLEGAEPAALERALGARLGLGPRSFYLTLPGDDAAVPLSAALPAGLTLVLHAARRPEEELLADLDASAAPGAAAAAEHPARQQLRQPALGDAPGSLPASLPLLSLQGRSPASGGLELSRMEPDMARLNSASYAESGAAEARPRAASVAGSQAEQAAELEQVAKSMDRFSRLSTDLANERTLLAWMRTSMAAVRTALALLAFSTQGIFLFSANVSRVAMVSLCLVAAWSGVRRYRRVKDATFMATPPQEFGRLSIDYFNYLVAVALVALCAGLYFKAWEGGH
ncbi:unnamed protein product [Prorocentrum cordatum]|uniref:DUF202 domain-containing protein n=1 Tax=Prorocentrum cordatum TaxID=2364126 RepID=A0ABN9TI06_9DINO|nr:unnamed protein product [Polarella glacialis]